MLPVSEVEINFWIQNLFCKNTNKLACLIPIRVGDKVLNTSKTVGMQQSEKEIITLRNIVKFVI